MGEQATGGYTIAVESVTSSDGRLRVWVRSVLPGGGPVTMMMTQPSDFVRVPARDAWWSSTIA